jgi:hypothetical protein
MPGIQVGQTKGDVVNAIKKDLLEYWGTEVCDGCESLDDGLCGTSEEERVKCLLRVLGDAYHETLE